MNDNFDGFALVDRHRSADLDGVGGRGNSQGRTHSETSGNYLCTTRVGGRALPAEATPRLIRVESLRPHSSGLPPNRVVRPIPPAP
jgi:hypothetical protein